MTVKEFVNYQMMQKVYIRIRHIFKETTSAKLLFGFIARF
jgi:hypothetical protein